METWDLHCDTLSELRYAQNRGEEISFLKNDLQIDLEKLKRGNYRFQCLACFVNLERHEENPLVSCLEMTDLFYCLLEKYPGDLMQVKDPEDIRKLSKSGKIGVMLTIEEGGVCLDDVRILRNLYRLGVRMMTLTWNFENGLASPNQVPGNIRNVWPCSASSRGLKEKGFEFLEEMERLHMILDVSHLSDGGFWDIAKYARRPFMASHSNARSICPHVRNLTDDMIRIMGEKGCLIGLNYCASFLDPCPDREKVRSRISDMAKHARYIMNLGGEDILALGSDFDGIEGELEVTGPQDLPLLEEGLIKEGFPERLVEKIFHQNAERFFLENL